MNKFYKSYHINFRHQWGLTLTKTLNREMFKTTEEHFAKGNTNAKQLFKTLANYNFIYNSIV
ncbi:MAG: hypothetical protein ACTS4T_01220 [Candidatus Hodgkinia cicadicola]